MVPSRLFADLSSNNSEFHAGPYQAAGHVIVAIKATEGAGYVNPDHRPWCLAAGGHRMHVVHYHFARPDLGHLPETEARFFLEVALPLTGGRDYLVLDLERAVPAGWQHDPAWSRQFDHHVQLRSRFRTILYSPRATLQSNPGPWLVGDDQRVWDADWSAGPDFAPPGMTVAFRQFTDGELGPDPHELPGVGRCDVNEARGATWLEILAHTPGV
ncbi:MAG: GH25 family lysozyme [Solirubrobacteraceae bacterium]